MQASTPRDDMQRERAGALLQRALDGRYRPSAFLDELARAYGVRRWSREAFMRAHARGALEGWRPGQRVAVAPGEIRITASSCPLDPHACQACQAFQREVALQALPEATDVWFDDRITHGDAACAMTIRVHDRPGASA